MPVIRLVTRIHAPPARCFDLSCSVDLHMHSAGRTREQVIAGVRTGMVGPGQQVTWRARHFGIWQQLTVEVESFDRPSHFRDRMVRGAFKSMVHDHWFAPDGPDTIMTDRFEFVTPLGMLGQLADLLFLRNYMERFLSERNEAIKRVAESDEWRKFLPAE